MARLTPLWEQNAAHSAQTVRNLISALFAEGVVGSGDGKVTQRAAGTNMSVDVAKGTFVIQGDTDVDQERYLCRSTTTENHPITAAPASGLFRRDRVIAEVRDAAVIGGTDNDWRFRVVAGTANAANPPPLPAIPGTAVELAQVSVASGVAAITNALIVDRRSTASPYSIVDVTNFPPVARDGALIYDTVYGTLSRGTAAGGYQNVTAGAVRMDAVSGTLLGGAAPPVATGRYLHIAGTADVGFIGAGILTIPAGAAGLDGIVSFNVTPKADLQPIFLTRSTHAALTVTQIPLRCWHADGTAFSGTVNVSFDVIGWT